MEERCPGGEARVLIPMEGEAFFVKDPGAAPGLIPPETPGGGRDPRWPRGRARRGQDREGQKMEEMCQVADVRSRAAR
jgi:hypothetical protein